MFPTTNLAGITALLALGILENIQEMDKVKPLLEMEHNSAEYLHTLIEAMRYVLQFAKFTASEYLSYFRDSLAFAGISNSYHGRSIGLISYSSQTVDIMSRTQKTSTCQSKSC
jgi:acetylornithine/succinyldiaminopimelate/putrescine aminotransferase